MKLLKQWLDRSAIKLATRIESASTPPVLPSSNREAASLLSDASLLIPPSAPARPALSADGVFHFPSNITSTSASNNIVRGKLFPVGPNAPVVVFVHGWNAELHYIYGLPRLARRLNKRGIAAIAFELPFHLTRRPRAPGVIRDFISNDLCEMLNGTRQAIADLEAILLWSRQQGARQTAVWGFSLGAWLAGLHLAVSRSVSAAVLTTPISDLKLAVETLPFCFPVRDALARTPAPLERLNLSEHSPLLSPERILVTQAAYDLFAPGHTCQTLAQKWRLPAPSHECVPQSHISILLSRRSMTSAIDWLAAAL